MQFRGQGKKKDLLRETGGRYFRLRADPFLQGVHIES